MNTKMKLCSLHGKTDCIECKERPNACWLDYHFVDSSGFTAAAIDISDLVQSKQIAYGDSFGKSGQIMKTLYPEGIPPDKMDDALTIVRVIDKLFRIATAKDAFGESPWKDIMGYALLATVRDGNARTN